MPIPAGSLSAIAQGLARRPTMYGKLKNYEREMEPLPQAPYMPGEPQDMLRGMDTLNLFKEQLLRPPVDPDAEAAGPPRSGLMPVSDDGSLAQVLASAIHGNNPMGGPQPEGLQHQQWTPLDMYPLPEGWIPPGVDLPRRPPPPADPIKRRTQPETRHVPIRRGQTI
jgi:hypothetical protein